MCVYICVSVCYIVCYAQSPYTYASQINTSSFFTVGECFSMCHLCFGYFLTLVDVFRKR